MIRVDVHNVDDDGVVDTVARFYMQPAGQSAAPGAWNWKVWAEHPGPNPAAADAWVFSSPGDDPIATVADAAAALTDKGASKVCRL